MLLRLIVVLFIGLCLAAHADMYTEIQGDGVYTTSDQSAASKSTERIKPYLQPGKRLDLAKQTDVALDGVFRIAVMNLKRHGYKQEAKEMQKEWAKHSGEVYRVVSASSRKITDFDPLSKYLAVAYMILEEKLGYDICRALRLSDIQTFNYTIPVVFHPCQYGEEEFTFHFVDDDPSTPQPYRGFAPCLSYWLTVITCEVVTYGAGTFFVCGPIGMLVELGVKQVVAPFLASKIYDWSCS